MLTHIKRHLCANIFFGIVLLSCTAILLSQRFVQFFESYSLPKAMRSVTLFKNYSAIKTIHVEKKQISEGAAIDPLKTFAARSVAQNTHHSSVSVPFRKIPNNIFMIELLNNSVWNPITECSVKSAARFNPKAKIILYSKRMIPAQSWNNLSNLELRYLDEEKLLRMSPKIYNWYSKKSTAADIFLLFEIADALRIILVNNFGGSHLDTDMLVLRQIPDHLTNVVAAQNLHSSINSAFLKFHANNSCLTLAEQNFPQQPRLWGATGPHLFSNIIRKCLNATETDSLIGKSSKDVTVLHPSKIFPIKWGDWGKLTDPRSLAQARTDIQNAYMLMVWRQAGIGQRSQGFQSGCLMDYLFTTLCDMNLTKAWRHYRKMVNDSGRVSKPQIDRFIAHKTF